MIDLVVFFYSISKANIAALYSWKHIIEILLKVILTWHEKSLSLIWILYISWPIPLAYSLSHSSGKESMLIPPDEAIRFEMQAIRPGAKQDLAKRFILISSTIINWSLVAGRFNDLKYKVLDSGFIN